MTKVRDFDEPMLLRAFDDLVTSENNGNAFLAKKTEKYRTMRVQRFCPKDEHETYHEKRKMRTRIMNTDHSMNYLLLHVFTLNIERDS